MKIDPYLPQAVPAGRDRETRRAAPPASPMPRQVGAALRRSRPSPNSHAAAVPGAPAAGRSGATAGPSASPDETAEAPFANPLPAGAGAIQSGLRPCGRLASVRGQTTCGSKRTGRSGRPGAFGRGRERRPRERPTCRGKRAPAPRAPAVAAGAAEGRHQPDPARGGWRGEPRRRPRAARSGAKRGSAAARRGHSRARAAWRSLTFS